MSGMGQPDEPLCVLDTLAGLRSYPAPVPRPKLTVSRGEPVDWGNGVILPTVKLSVYHAPAAKSKVQEARESAAALRKRTCSICGAVDPRPCAFAGCPISYSLDQAREEARQGAR